MESNVISLYATASSLEEGRKIARSLVEKHLVACVNIVPVESIYRFRGKIEEEREVALFLKTRRDLVPRVEEEFQRLSSYEVPCLVETPVVGGLPSYLRYVEEETEPPAGREDRENR